MSEDAENQDDRRRAQRWKVFEIAAVKGQNATVAGVIDDISATGALISVDHDFPIGEPVSFEIEGFEAIPARVVHARRTLIGLDFQMTPPQADKLSAWLAEVEKEDR